MELKVNLVHQELKDHLAQMSVLSTLVLNLMCNVFQGPTGPQGPQGFNGTDGSKGLKGEPVRHLI